MKISLTARPVSFLTVLTLSVVSLALGTFLSFSPGTNGPDAPGTRFLVPGDTLRPARTNPADSGYLIHIRNADRLCTEKKIEPALKELMEAQKMRPDDPVLKDRILKLKAQIAEQNNREQECRKAIASGDGYFNVKDYLNAKASYQMAVQKNPDDSVAKAKLKKTMDLLRSSKAQNILYDVAVASADKLFQTKEYEKAKAEYENALKILPGEQYPKSKINEIIKIQVDVQVKDEEYGKAIAVADKFYTSKAYQSALLEYRKANTIKPGEKYPLDRISELTRLIGEQKARDEAYDKALAIGDQLFMEVRYKESVTAYQQALKIKPDQVYPKNRIREIEGMMAAAQKAQDDYDRYINLADSLYIDKKYSRAREHYQLASSVKPKENYPREMLSKVDKMLTGEEAAMAKAIDEQYLAAILSADNHFGEKAYQEAKSDYEKALGLKPLDQYPRDKILEIDRILETIAREQAATLEAKKALDARYKTILTNADKLLAIKSYEKSREEYLVAADLKPSELYPKDKIIEIDRILGDIAARKTLEDRFARLVKNADSLLALNDFERALQDYREASALKPAEFYPKKKIAETEQVIQSMARQEQIENSYRRTLENGDSLFRIKSYDHALAAYQAALKFKPAEGYPKEKIIEINRITTEIAKQKNLEDQYQAAIGRGDKLFSEKSWTLARTEYGNALKIKSGETYPAGKVTQIDSILTRQQEQKALDQQFGSIIAGANKLFASKEYGQARQEYAKALELKPEERYPADKILEIEKILSEIASKKALDDQYALTINAADQFLLEKKLAEAKTAYLTASGLKPSDSYPKKKIAEIDQSLQEIALKEALENQYSHFIRVGDSLLNTGEYLPSRNAYQEALKLKPTEPYPKEKTASIDKVLADRAAAKALDDEYSSLITKADELLAQKSYEPARAGYEKALLLKPADNYPKARISEIDKAQSDIAAQKELDTRYQSVVRNAESLLASKSYEQAKAEFEKALTIKPGEQVPGDRILEIEKILSEIAAKKALDEQYKASILSADKMYTAKTWEAARNEYLNALSLKPGELYPKIRIGQVDSVMTAIAKQKAVNEEYTAAITSADLFFTQKDFGKAKAEYIRAADLKPAEQYPRTRLTETERKLKQLADIQAIDEQYTAALASADKLFSEKSYDQAKTAYAEAGRIKPLEQYPREKIAEINTLLAEIARQIELNGRYNGLIEKADQFMLATNWEQARIEYGNALKLKPNETYPGEKITEIDGILAGIRAKEESYKAALAQADQMLAGKKWEEARSGYENALTIKPEATYPRDKILEINKTLEELLGKRKLYETFVTSGDKSLAEKDYLKAKEGYNQALGLFPQESYPKEMISIITARIDSIYRANKSFYDKAVADGDKYFNTFEYDKAVDAFTLAGTYLPMEPYPREMITRIRRTLAENAIAEVVNTSVTISAGTEKQFTFPPVNMASRKNNFIYLRMKNLSGKPFNILMRYGKDKQPNGGVVIRNLTLDGKVNERLVSVKDQDLWYREDNNWISLYPQGGDIEVSYIQVSRAK